MTRGPASTRIQRTPVTRAARVQVEDVGDEVLQLGEALQARVARADEDVGQELAPRGAVLERLGLLERAQDVVAQRDRLGQRLEAARVLGEARDRQRAADRADGDDELVVGEVLDRALEVLDLQRVALRRRAGDPAEAQVDAARQLLAQRHDDVARLEHARRGARQQRRVEHEVDVVDEPDARAVRGQQARERAGGVEAHRSPRRR